MVKFKFMYEEGAFCSALPSFQEVPRIAKCDLQEFWGIIRYQFLGRNKLQPNGPWRVFTLSSVLTLNLSGRTVKHSEKEEGHEMIVLFIGPRSRFSWGEHSLGLLGYQSHQLSLLNSRPQVLQHQQLHILLRLPCRSADVRQQNNAIVADELGVDFGFLFKDVETCREDLFALDGLDEGGFVDDGSSGCVDNDNAVFHHVELCSGDDVFGRRVEGEVETQNI